MQDKKVSYYANMKSATDEKYSVVDVLRRIKEGECRFQIEQLRKYKQVGNKEMANKIKAYLPAVTFCATFNGRRVTSNVSSYNYLMVIDVDKLDGEEMGRVGKCLEDDLYVGAYWISPSGNGYKGLIELEYHNCPKDVPVWNDWHRVAFLQIEEYLSSTYKIELDGSGKDITRLCFMSWSPELMVRKDNKPFVIDLSDIRKRTVPDVPKVKVARLNESVVGEAIAWNILDGTSNKRNDSTDRQLIENIYRYLRKTGQSITSSYEDWVKVAFSIANTFHPVYGRRMFMKFCELDMATHDVVRSEKLIYDAYTTLDKRCDISTIRYLASQKGFIH